MVSFLEIISNESKDNQRASNYTNNDTNDGTLWDTLAVFVQVGRNRKWKGILLVVNFLRIRITFAIFVVGIKLDLRIRDVDVFRAIVRNEVERLIATIWRSFIQNDVKRSIQWNAAIDSQRSITLSDNKRDGVVCWLFKVSFYKYTVIACFELKVLSDHKSVWRFIFERVNP